MDTDVVVDAAALEDGLAALESARSWSPRVISRLEARIRTGEDLALFRVNPKAWAAETSTDEAEAVDLFLHAAHAGLFQMEWILVCASCGNTARSFRALARVDPHFICELCQMVNGPSLDEYIQVAFTISPRIRHIAYHDPDSLSAEDRYFNYQVSRDVRSRDGALTELQALRDSTHHVGYVEAEASSEVDFDFRGEALAVRDLLHAASAMFMASGEEAPRLELRLVLEDGHIADLDRQLQPSEFRLTERAEMRLLFPATAHLPHGHVRLHFQNRMRERCSLWVVEYPTVPAVFEPVEFEPVLSAKEALSTQTFRTLFRSETVAASESLEILDLTFLFTDLRDSTAMYERIGDASAYNLVRLHFDALQAVIEEHRGAIVKTIGDAIMATFVEPASGVRAALDMAARLAEFNRHSATDLVLKMGLHRGHAIAVTSADSVDYFGQTVNIAARVQAMAQPGQVCLSEDVYGAAGVADVVAGLPSVTEPGIMKGVSESIAVHRVTLA